MDMDDEAEKFKKFVEEILEQNQKAYQSQMLNDLYYGPYKTNTKDYFSFNSPIIVQTLHKTDDLLIEYHEKAGKYICKYLALDITITIPLDMLATKLGIYETYYGIGQHTKQYTLSQICSRIVFAIKNFGPTLNAIYDRIKENSKKKLDIPWNISYIREESNLIEGPDWEIMERV
jgi:hypothetical protein